jgi:hypothetical protein
LRVATFNLQNLGPHAGDDRIRRVTRVIVDDLGAPDLVALQEVAFPLETDAPGPVPATAFYRTLLEHLSEAGQECYRALEVAPRKDEDGGHPGLSIRNAMLYRPGNLTLDFADPSAPDEPPCCRRNPERILGGHPAFAGDPLRHWRPGRKPLVARFKVGRSQLLAVCCHLKSMRGDSRKERQHANKQRHVQAEAIAEFLGQVLDSVPDMLILVLGDMNDTTGSKTLDTLKGQHLCNLVETIPKRTRYTRRHGGKPQALDHLLVDRRLQRSARVWIPHTNTDVAPNHRCSDHDPVVAELCI